MAEKIINILILCTGNSARSILGEALINRLGQGRLRGFSAGSSPTGTVNPFAKRLLEAKGYPSDGLRSKSWDEFSGDGAQEIDFVLTVCDNAAEETCPIWPGHPAQAHWGIPDPALVEGTDEDKMQVFAKAYEQLEKRITAFTKLSLENLDDESLKRALDAIGRL